MRYYEVIPASKSYHGKESLTYCHEKILAPGQAVGISLRGHSSIGIVLEDTAKPDFKTEKIEDIFSFTLSEEQMSLLKWMLEYYPAPMGTIAMLFAPSLVSKLTPAEPIQDKEEYSVKVSPPKLNGEQQKAYDHIKTSEDHTTFLLHGVTGSGKTRIYLELAGDSLKQGRSVIILTPEISLTAPIAKQFEEVFGNLVIINHSSLTPKQRVGTWARLSYGKGPYIVVGPRSSLFMPVKKAGLIVVDEFHETAYKQESQPFYHASRVASMLSRLSSSKLVFGSATPPVNEYFFAEQKKAPIITLEKSAITGNKPTSTNVVVSLREPNERSPYPLISKTLISSIASAIGKKEQAMLFINRRGSARSISCQDCGYKELCENCELPMVYHADQHLVRCHTCGNKKRPPSNCPDCGSLNIFFSSPGTKAIADNLAKLFPGAKVLRFDKDNKKSDRMENVYDKVVNEADIIVGTQIIAKGHDLPRLSLVAMLQADSGLDFPDYTSTEKSYQLIKQLAGRTNRGHVAGTFLIQTFNPDNRLIGLALDKGWEEFYKNEISQRKKHGFPPFYSVLKIESSKKTRASAERSLSELAKVLSKISKNLIILGPSPSFVEKKSSNWHWQLLIKARNRSDLLKVAKKIPSSFRIDIDPINFL